MKRRSVAIMLSALVLPGLGQLYLGRRLKGGIIIALVNVFLLVALFVALRGIGRLALSGHAVTGMGDAYRAVAAVPQESAAGRWLLASFFCLWSYAVIDLFLKRHGDRE